MDQETKKIAKRLANKIIKMNQWPIRPLLRIA